jgi:hypothetical protein
MMHKLKLEGEKNLNELHATAEPDKKTDEKTF